MAIFRKRNGDLALAEEKLRVVAQRMEIRLASLGFGKGGRDMPFQGVSFAKGALSFPSRRFGGLWIDPLTLPPGVLTADLASDKVLFELRQAIGYRVKAKTDGIGLAYVIDFDSTKETLPRHIPFRMSDRPRDIPYAVPLGVASSGPYWVSLADYPNILVGGTTGSGKSNLIHTIICALLVIYDSERLKLAIIDPKGGVELGCYRGLPHLRGFAANLTEAKDLLAVLHDEMKRREALFKMQGVRKFTDYRDLTGETLPQELLIVDEYLDLAVMEGESLRSPFTRELARYTSVCRALGGNVLLSASTPKAEVVNTAIRSNCSIRVAFWPASRSHARTILGDDLPSTVSLPSRKVQGRALVRVGPEYRTVQAYYLTDDRIKDILKGRGVATAILTRQEAEMVMYAVNELDTQFTLGDIRRQFGPARDGGISYRRLTDTAKQWERMGLLTPQDDITTSRRVTERLERLALTVLRSDRDDLERIIDTA